MTGPFDAVLPLHLKDIFGFNALTSGAAFASLAVPEIVLGPVAGWVVDRYGSKLSALIGFLPLCPLLFLLVIPQAPASPMQIFMLILLLLLNGYDFISLIVFYSSFSFGRGGGTADL